jgi:hypothetical protein
MHNTAIAPAAHAARESRFLGSNQADLITVLVKERNVVALVVEPAQGLDLGAYVSAERLCFAYI